MDAGKGKETLMSHAHLVKERNAAAGNKVKLCGYLKKKRNRVGGWRKLWFVLQDKLLLSYGSKEEYDNKLVSFKDVLNLVPGTLVRPLGGFRFTIETTSQAMYTFHCDDRSAYREWIAKLLDSLATQPSVARVQKFSHRFCNYSVDNIPNALSIMTTSSTSTFSSNLTSAVTHSFDSISHAERIGAVVPQQPPLLPPPPSSLVVGGGCVRLPIAHNTAKILERNGVNSTDLQVLLCNRKAANSSCARYHHNQEDYSNNDQHFRLHYNNVARSSASDLRTCTNSIYQSASAQSVLMINRLFGNSVNDHHLQRLRISPSNCNFEAAAIKDKSKRNCDRIYENASAFESETATASCTKDCKALGLVKDQIQRMSIKGSRESTLDAETDKQRTKVTTTTSVEQVIMQPKSATVPNGNVDPAGIANRNNNLQLEPIYAVIDLKHKYAHRKMRNSNVDLVGKRSNSYDSIIHSMATTEQPTTMTNKEKSSSFTEDDIDGIYEDGDTFFSPSSTSSSSKGRQVVDEDDEEENIYEPINVSSSHHHQPNAFWRYFTRLKVNSFLHLTRMRKRSSDYDNSSKVPPTKLPQQFVSSIKHKFGTHRKSMQMRMRRLCKRAVHQPFSHSTAAGATISSNGGAATVPTMSASNGSKTKSKYRWKSVKVRPKHHVNVSSSLNNSNGGAGDRTKAVEKRFFDSLPHLRKSRASLFVDNATTAVTITQNRLILEDGGGSNKTDVDSTHLTADST